MRNKWIGKGMVVLAALLFTGGILLLLKKGEQQSVPAVAEEREEERSYRRITVDGTDYQYNTDLITVLLLGIDARDDTMTGQADSIALAVFDRAEKRIRLIAISRDSMVPVRIFDAVGNDLGWDTQHLALAYSFAANSRKGCQLTKEAVSKMFHGIPIVYYGAANIQAIPEFHNLVGEITVQIPDDNLKYLDDDLIKGKSLTLTSENVEQFVRARDIDQEYSNAGRMWRQKLYIQAYLEKIRTLLKEDFSGMTDRMEELLPNTVTNVGLSDLSSFEEMLEKYRFDAEEDYYIVQGTNQTGAYHDEFLVDEEALQQLVLQIFYRKR